MLTDKHGIEVESGDILLMDYADIKKIERKHEVVDKGRIVVYASSEGDQLVIVDGAGNKIPIVDGFNVSQDFEIICNSNIFTKH